MKHTRKLIVAALAVVAAMALAVPALAFAAGTGTITVENATYGKDYTAYKIFDAEYDSQDASKISYKVDAAHKEFVDTALFNVSTAADSSGKYSVWKKDGVTDEQIITWAKANYKKFDSTGEPGTFDSTKAKVTFANMPYGYYYITSTMGSAIAIDSSNPNATVKDKNASAPTDPVKTIVKVDNTDADNPTSANAHVGSTIQFKITGNATNYTTIVSGTTVTSTQNTAYAFEDTFTNLSVDTNSYIVKVNGNEISNFTATIDGNKISFNIPLVDNNGAAIYPAKNENDAYIPIEITYSATITAAAADSPAKNEIGDSKVEIDTYAFQVAKTDGTDPLPGAQFELWANGAALKFIDNGDGTYTYSDSADGGVTTLDMTTNTTITVKGLDNSWTYTLKEITVPNGYNQAEDKDIVGSSLTKVDADISTLTLYKEIVENKQGSVLPSTGGIGTTIFYVVGGILIAVAAIFLITRKRVANARKEDEEI